MGLSKTSLPGARCWGALITRTSGGSRSTTTLAQSSWGWVGRGEASPHAHMLLRLSQLSLNKQSTKQRNKQRLTHKQKNKQKRKQPNKQTNKQTRTHTKRGGSPKEGLPRVIVALMRCRCALSECGRAAEARDGQPGSSQHGRRLWQGGGPL